MFVRLAVYLDIRRSMAVLTLDQRAGLCLHRYLIQNVPIAHTATGARIADRMIKWHEFAFPMLANFFFKVRFFFEVDRGALQCTELQSMNVTPRLKLEDM